MSSVLVRSFGVVALCGALVGCGGTGGGSSNTTGNLSPGSDAATSGPSSTTDMATTPTSSNDAGSTQTPDGATAPITVPTGAWQVKTATDEMVAGFATLTINADNTYAQTGRTDGIGQTGVWSQPSTITIDPGFGDAPAGLAGPYLALDDNPIGDQEFVYEWAEAADHSSLTLTLWARTNGMGLRWAQGQVINLVPANGTLPATPAGQWQVASEADANTIGFQTLELDASGFYAESGRTDGEAVYGNWTTVTTPPVDPSFGNAPAGMTGPYISLDNSQYNGDGAWVYGWSEAADGSTLTLTLYAQRYGMGLRWATSVVTVTLVKGSTGAAPTGAWKTASTADTTAAGFSGITFWLDGNYTQTGRTDGQSGQGKYTLPTSIPVDTSSYGAAPAGMTGPYISLSNATSNGDGIWDYSWVINPDSSLTLTLYAKTNGMGLRWATPTTIKLLKN